MSASANIQSALNTRAATITQLPLVYREIPGEKPTEYIEVDFIPNESNRIGLKGSDAMDNMGLYQLSVCKRHGQYEVVYRALAETIAAYFPADTALTFGGTRVEVIKTEVGRGLPDGPHWRIPVTVYYRAIA